MDITHITSLLGGVALFLYGMSIMGAGLEKLAGGKMQGVLQKLTSSTIKGVIFGTLITGVIQSSAGTVVICVGLVNSGIMTLTQSVGVIMGANIGTTVTGQLIRIKRGETGYYPSEWDTGDKEQNVELADELNEKLGVSPIQRQAMEVGSMAGWDVQGADPAK